MNAYLQGATLPVIRGHQVTQAELDAINKLSEPHLSSMEPIDLEMSPAQCRREARRRARQMLPEITAAAEKQVQAETIDGKPVAGMLLTTFFIMMVLPQLVCWIVEELIMWLIKRNWPTMNGPVES